MAGNIIDSGFSLSVREFIDECNRLNDLMFELEISSDIDTLTMDVEKELQLFRILQEAVSNIRKHSRSSEASVSLKKGKSINNAHF